MSGRVSIIIPAHGHAGMTRACVDAVLASDAGRMDIEIIVVDDASPQPVTVASHPSVRVIRNDRNRGFAASCNVGADAATGDWMLFLNNDTEVAGPWLPRMLECAAPDVAIVGARLLYGDGTAQHAGIVFSVGDGLPRHVYRGFPGDHRAVTRTREMQAVTGACLLVRRSAFAPGGFDSGYVNGFEDIDLCMRVRAAGQRVIYCGATSITHLESVSLRADTAVDERHGANAERFGERWGDDVRRDEISVYADDELIAAVEDDVYPLAFTIAPELGATADGAVAGIARLLNVRSRQVYDLQKTVGGLRAELHERSRPE